MPFHVALSVTERSQVAEARRRAAALVRGADEPRAGALALVVTELATNLLKHANGGELLMRRVADGVEILALDSGRGMADIERCLVDGFSTAGSPGTGLGAVRRLSRSFDIYSAVGTGTAVMAYVLTSPAGAALGTWDVGAISVPRAGEETCGDDWAALESGDGLTVLVVDGLGHGLGATDASRAAVDSFHKNSLLTPTELFERLHTALRPTRGAAVGVARLDTQRGMLVFCGVGNIAGTIFMGTGSRQVVSLPGIVGHEIRKVVEFTYPWSPDAVVVLHSDGVRSPGAIAERYPGLLGRHPALVAGVLYRDLKRERDDATVVVVRISRQARR